MSDRLTQLVEATIVSIDFRSDEDEIVLVFASPGCGERIQLRCLGVDDLMITDMRMTNIVDSAEIFSGDLNDSELSDMATMVFSLMRGRAMVEEDRLWPPLADRMELIRTGRMKLLILRPVYGASALILAREISSSKIEI